MTVTARNATRLGLAALAALAIAVGGAVAATEAEAYGGWTCGGLEDPCKMK